MAWLFWPVALAGMSRIGRYMPYGVAALARIAGRYVITAMSRTGRYLLREDAALDRVAGRYEPYWPLFAV